MQTSFPKHQRLRDYTSTPFELFIALFSILPFFALAYFYTALPERVPLFLSLTGEVAVWGEKSWMSVFRVPLMAVVTQVFCLLMKYGIVQSEAALPAESYSDYARLRKQLVFINVGLWDCFRLLVAFKMSAASLNTIFLSIERFKFLSRPAFVIAFIAGTLSIAGALFYGYRLLSVRRKIKQSFKDVPETQRAVDVERVYGGMLYFNPSDSALFVSRYAFNFANKWVWVFLGCLLVYPLLVFLPT